MKNLLTAKFNKLGRKAVLFALSFAVILGAAVAYHSLTAQAGTLELLNGDGDFETLTKYNNWATVNQTGTTLFQRSTTQANNGAYSARAYISTAVSNTSRYSYFSHNFTTPNTSLSNITVNLDGYFWKNVSGTSNFTRFEIEYEILRVSDSASLASGVINNTISTTGSWTRFPTLNIQLAPNTEYQLRLITDVQIGGTTRTFNVYWDDITINYTDNPPTVCNMVGPANGTNRKGVIELQANAVDDLFIDNVEFIFADNTSFNNATTLTGASLTSGSRTNGTWSLNWDTSALNGTYYVKAKATDMAPAQMAGPYTLESSYFTYYIDNTAPNVAAVTVPLNFSYLLGTITLTADAQDNTGVTTLDFQYADNPSFAGATTVTGATRISGTATNGTWTKSGFDTTALAEGTWYFRAVATDGWGNSFTGAAIQADIDRTNPTAAIIVSPTDLGTVTGTIDLTVNAQDAKRVEAVVFEYDDNSSFSSPTQLNGASLISGTVINGLWRYAGFDTASVPDGPLYIRAKATDAANNSFTDSYVTVTVHNDPPTEATVTSPVNGAELSEIITFAASAQDFIGVASVDFEVSHDAGFTDPTVITGAALTSGTIQNGTWSKEVNTGLMTDGNYYIRAKVTDLAGQVLRGSGVNVDVDNLPPSFAVEYYTDSELIQPLKTLNGKPVTKAQTVYVKVIPNEALSAAPTLNIDVPGTTGDRLGVTASFINGSFVYVWNVTAEADGEAYITVTGTDNFTKTSTNAVPTSGGNVIIDTFIAQPTLAGQKGVGRTTLTWSTQEDHYRYYIYRSMEDSFTPNDEINKIAEVAAPAARYSDSIGEGTYFYRIRVLDLAGNVSTYSAQAAVQSLLPTVTMVAYWDDVGGGSTVFWANDVTDSGTELNWLPGSVFEPGTANAYTVIENANMYENYFVKVVQQDETRIIRAYPTAQSTGQGDWIDSSYAHGNFAQATELCAACHVTHSGLKESLLKEATYYELCIFCHGTASSQSKYDVQSGKVLTVDGWKDSLGGPISPDFGNSSHNVDDRDDVVSTVYGSAPGKTLTFTCLSCHKPHAGKNDNYRLLRETIYPSDDKFTSKSISFEAYAIVKDATVGEEVYLVSGSSEFCSACHSDYVKGTPSEAGGTYSSFYRHPVSVNDRVYSVYNSSPFKDLFPQPTDKLPLQSYPEGDSPGSDKRTAVVCLTCHYAHGSTRVFDMGYPMPNGLPRLFVENQKMLRLDNYGVCESCHKK